MEKNADKRRSVGSLVSSRIQQFSQGDKGTPLSHGQASSTKQKKFQKYETLEIFKAPVQLIYADEDKKLHYNENAVRELMEVDHEVNVIAIVGLYRTGKSLLLNRLARDTKAFGVGHTCNAMTMGIWIMCVPHPTQESQVLVLLDTEGIGAVLEDKLLEDRWHFLLATLLSSTLVYNHKGMLDADAIDKLTFLEGIKTSMRVVDSTSEDDSNFDVFFPSFVMVIRDNNLILTDIKGNPISSDRYLDNALTMKPGNTDSLKRYNKPRYLIRKYFKERKCFTIAPPANQKALDDWKSPKNAEFEKGVEEFQRYIYGCKPKRMTSGRALNGRMLGCLVRSYVGFIQDGKPPCMHTAVKAMVKYENQNLVQTAQEVYKKEMQSLMPGNNLPTAESMAKFHLQSTDKAVEFMKGAILYDDVELFMDTAMESFNEVSDRLMQSITKDSEKICWGRLNYLNMQTIQKNMNNKAYEHITGYDKYMNDVELVIKQYKETMGLGPKNSFQEHLKAELECSEKYKNNLYYSKQKQQVLQTYLDNKAEEEEMIYQMVKAAQKELKTDGKQSDTKDMDRSRIRTISKNTTDNLISALINRVKADQGALKKELNSTFQHFKKLKDKELNRQVDENVDVVRETEKDFQRFETMFLRSQPLQTVKWGGSKCNIL